jgi:hypothetical protein
MKPEERQERHGIVRGNDMDRWLAQQLAAYGALPEHRSLGDGGFVGSPAGSSWSG